MKKRNVAKRVSSKTRANGLYSLELRKIGPKFSISQDKKKQKAKNQCRQKGSKNESFYFFSANTNPIFFEVLRLSVFFS